MKITIGKLLATVISLGYLVYACVSPQQVEVFLNPMSPFLALGIIWFAEWLGEFTGFLPSAMAYQSKSSGGFVFTLLGWALLLGGPPFMWMCFQ